MGYTLLVWGVATVRGCNVSFTNVAWPGKFTGCNPDTGSSSNVNSDAGPGTKTGRVADKDGQKIVVRAH